jgi:hypothetical protein
MLSVVVPPVIVLLGGSTISKVSTCAAVHIPDVPDDKNVVLEEEDATTLLSAATAGKAQHLRGVTRQDENYQVHRKDGATMPMATAVMSSAKLQEGEEREEERKKVGTSDDIGPSSSAALIMTSRAGNMKKFPPAFLDTLPSSIATHLKTSSLIRKESADVTASSHIHPSGSSSGKNGKYLWCKIHRQSCQ